VHTRTGRLARARSGQQSKQPYTLFSALSAAAKNTPHHRSVSYA